MKEFIKSMLTKAEPTSSMRFVMVFSVLFIVLTTVGTWAITCLIKRSIEDFPAGAATFFVSLVLIMIAGKVSQTVWGEKIIGRDAIEDKKDDIQK